MGYLDNSTIVVDAVLTKEGRRLLSEGQGLDIQFFTLSDSGIDYNLWNPDHPSGSAFYGEAIENLPSLEALPRGQFYMRNKLITLGKGVTSIPYWKVDQSTDFKIIDIDGTITAVKNDGVRVDFDIIGSDGEGQYQLTIPNATALGSISAGDYGASGWTPQSLSNEDGQSVSYLQNIEAADAAFYNLNPGSNSFSLVFKPTNVTAVMDCSLISLNTGITKTFRLNITAIT
tara:strand:+ start:14843 stop:15532 length:690 start_codon:yes stop_codon:yes gene_type:complete